MVNRSIYLVRHGRLQTVDDLRRYIGHSDVPLNEVGILQAHNLQKKIVQADIKSVFCSDLSRSWRTAEIIVGDKKVPIISRHELREINMGEWEGCSFSDITCRFPDEFKRRGEDIENYCVPGGESFADCKRRVLPVFQEIMENTYGDVLFVGHAGVNRLLLCHVLELPLANIFRLCQDYGCLNIIHQDQTGYRVKLLNER